MTRRAVMDRVFPSPVIVGTERENARDETDDVVDATRCEKRAVAAVVKDDEYTYEKATGKHRKRDREPQRYGGDQIHQIPEQRVRDERIDELPHRALRRGLLILGDNRAPIRRIGLASP